MKISLSFPLLVLSSAALVLPSCMITMLDVHPHQVPFDEVEFAAYRMPGSSTLTGQLSVFIDGAMHNGSGCTIELLPVTSYTNEMVDRELGNAERLVGTNSGLKKYVRTVTADSSGRFTFTGLPTGEYFVFGDVKWNPQTLYPEYDQYQWGCERVTVRNGQVTSVMVSHNPNRGHGVLAYDTI